MNRILSPDGPQQLLTDLCRVVAERASAEREISICLEKSELRAATAFQESQQRLDNKQQRETAKAEQEREAMRAKTLETFQSEQIALEKEYKAVRREALTQAAAERQSASDALRDAREQALHTANLTCGNLYVPLKGLLAGLDSRWQELVKIHNRAAELMQRRGQWDDLPAAAPAEVTLESHPGWRFFRAVDDARIQLAELSTQTLPRLFQGFRPYAILILLWALSAAPLIDFFGWTDWRWIAISAGFTALFSSIAGAVVSNKATRQSVKAYLALRQTLLQAGLGQAGTLETAKAECQQRFATVHANYKKQMQQAEAAYAAALADSQQRKDERLQRADGEYPRRLAELANWRQRTIIDLEDKHASVLGEAERRYRDESGQRRVRHATHIKVCRQRFELDWDEMAQRWHAGIAQFRASAAEIERVCRETCPDWSTDDWSRWKAASAIPPLVGFANSRVELAAIDAGLPDDPRLRPEQLEFALPMVLPYPRLSLLLLKAGGRERGAAVEAMQSTMLRLLTAMPPGKVRFTIVDPVGLGDSFSAFMHLADYDPQLVTNRIWTDASHIEQRLADLTKHMEDVLQVYLRKEFQSIEEYNAFAGEMAEPYRVLVVADFPTNFTEAAADRLKSIVASGARCGVFVLMSVDETLPFPRNFQLAELERDGMVLPWSEPLAEPDTSPPPCEGGFVWEHAEFGPLAVKIPPPPPPESFKATVQAIGSAAKELGRVEVSFSCIAPETHEWWTADGRKGIDVPLGRAGALKLQHLSLGGGTSQHVLVSGKTGSGKSTLLHVLITNVALRYSPDEVELYLVDFKRGVEFKAYARCGLPHARVVAIESEREFGLSVLERLDAELRDRGDLFRTRAVQDLKGFRAAEPAARIPRILLIIDEFQELFVEDDRIAQEAALLLDRLVRQGRAFGIHVLLGSQTLGGAYTLARSTIGQMAVRIALQCSEADAHLILSEENTAARLLTRPGEAIYNDANGLYEGNHPFQIVWLPDGERDEYLRQISEFARQKQCILPPPIVFEGNALADPGDNPKLSELLQAGSWPAAAVAVPAWLGSAVAIKDPTVAVFLRESGSNLLLVGPREEGALGVMAASFISLAAQLAPGLGTSVPSCAVTQEDSGASNNTGPRFYIFDGMRSDAPEVGFWNRVASATPHRVKVSGVGDAAETIAEIAVELASRQREGQENAPPIFLFLYNLGRFRDLKKDDDFGFSSSDEQPASPAKQFAAILREGPPLGIHCVTWCDTYSNVNRMLDRQSLRDFEMRVLFQMNANDSSSLMDTPEAARLGVHRAIFYHAAEGRTEKFRPYGLPSQQWLARVKQRLAR